MRIVYLGQTGPYGPVALRELLNAQSRGVGGFDIVQVIEGLRRQSGRTVHREVKPQPGSLPDGEDLTALASAAGIPVLQTSEINERQPLRLVERLEPDWLVCVGFDRLFCPALLAAPRQGGVNAHPSRLPELRGPSPIFWAVKHGLRRLGVTLHRLDAREDHGPIYAQREFELPRRAGGDDIFNIAARLAGQMLVEFLGKAAEGRVEAIPQQDGRATRAPRPQAEDARLDPKQWAAEHLIDFACAAPFFRSPWLKLGDDVFFLRRGVDCELGRRLPAEYVQQGNLLMVQCRDGVATLEIQI